MSRGRKIKMKYMCIIYLHLLPALGLLWREHICLWLLQYWPRPGLLVENTLTLLAYIAQKSPFVGDFLQLPQTAEKETIWWWWWFICIGEHIYREFSLCCLAAGFRYLREGCVNIKKISTPVSLISDCWWVLVLINVNNITHQITLWFSVKTILGHYYD